MRSRAIALLFVLAGCTWIHRHPAVTAATVTGAVAGFGACELGDSQGKISTCLEISGVVAVALGGLALLATTFLDTGEHTPPPPPPSRIELGNDGAIRLHTHTLPPPVPVDAGPATIDASVPDAPPAPPDASLGLDAAS